jgi:hypothetical protein
MIKGINKRVVMLRLEGNRLYESVCFVVRRDVERRREEEKDMLREANRILSEMELRGARKKGRWKRAVLCALMLVIGIAVGAGLASVYSLFF